MFKYELYKSVYINFSNGNKMKKRYIEPYKNRYTMFINQVLKRQYNSILTEEIFNNDDKKKKLLLKKV